MSTNETAKWMSMMINVVFVITVSQSCVRGEPKVPCFFIFGDSLADNGNNNRLRTPARANYEPYGIDFPQGPTGRFTNGRTTVDFIAEFLGFEDPIPCYANTKGFKNMVRGLNYASASAGVRDETGSHMGENVNLNKQLLNHKSTVKRITSIMGLKRLSRQHLQKCLYSVGLGSNDYLMNYFQPKFYPTSKRYTPEQYASVLIKQYSKQMKTLYKYGARKVVLNGVGQVGCTPSSISTTNGSTCAENMNNAVQFFNQKLKSLVDQLNTELTHAKFIYVDMFGISGSPSEITAAGIKVTKANCCPVDEFGQCVRSKGTCQNRSEYAFWDLFHPTEASNLIIARKSYNSSNLSDTYPANIQHLVQLRL
ncbi:GDSL esterase/lipase At1g29670-like [Pyrus x bretschneideri]|uniref:GDSL esterase/lipase At1g29670-like n=1 Tax=Pyrus x bretschneideri TaxID=225117 RepID=UPI00202F2F07|nr:GDSL esterase/lipase At1g29670-like [Pyrus x bretschneideri]